MKINGLDEDILRSFVERIVSIEEERADLASEIKSIYVEAKGEGFVPAALRKLVKLRLETIDAGIKRHEIERVVNSYRVALGMLADTPLGEAAVTKITLNDLSRMAGIEARA